MTVVYVLIGICVLIGVCAIIYLIHSTKCAECGKYFAMKEIERNLVSQFRTTVDVEQKVKDKNGNVTGTYTQAVPATVYVYDCVDRCKHCGFQRKVTRRITVRD